MNKDIISIVVPNYNNGEYLEECIASIQDQSYSNIEILIVDDASSDGSQDIIANLAAADDRIVPVFNSKNLGISTNRHNGIMAATGSYITTLDADDYLINKRKLEMEYTTIMSRADAETIAFSRFVLVNRNGAVMREQCMDEIKEGSLFECIIARDCMIPRDYMFTRKQYVDSGGLNSKIKMYEDWDLKIRMSRLFKFYYTGVDGIAYRRHRQGLSSVKRPVHYKWLMRVYTINKKKYGDQISDDMSNRFSEFINRNFSISDKLLGFVLWNS